MCKRYLALVTLAIALVVNVTAFAGSKEDNSDLKIYKAEAGSTLKVKAEEKASNKVFRIKSRGGGMLAKVTYLKLKRGGV